MGAGCSIPSYDSSLTTVDASQRQSVIDQANLYLTQSDCSNAIATLSALYSSSFTDNSVRLAMASAYGCSAGINVFNLTGDLVTQGSALGGAAFWEFLVTEFPSVASPDDKKPQAGQNGMDAVLAAINPGTILISAYTVNAASYNPGSLITADRVNDANAYLGFLSMSVMGSLLYRYGAPSANHHKSQALTWTTPALVAGDGCAFASALLNYTDSLAFLSTVASATVAPTYKAIYTFLKSSVDTACSTGCLLNGCSTACTTCPTTLRNRSNCTGLVTDLNSCAAAGIAIFVNTSWSGPP